MWMINEIQTGKTEFSVDEDAHVIADCIKVCIYMFEFRGRKLNE